MEQRIRTFFERYARLFQQALDGDADMDQVASLYAPEFLAASPHGVASGKNDTGLRQAMARGYARYRAMGMTTIRFRGLRISPVDDLHCVAHVAWAGIYARSDRANVTIEFDVHYLVRALPDEDVKVFGWISGDEQAVLRQHGIA